MDTIEELNEEHKKVSDFIKQGIGNFRQRLAELEWQYDDMYMRNRSVYDLKRIKAEIKMTAACIRIYQRVLKDQDIEHTVELYSRSLGK